MDRLDGSQPKLLPSAYDSHPQLSQPFQQQQPSPHTGQQAPLRCPRCNSHRTKFLYYNNNNVNQPRHICKTCRWRWTVGGALRDVAITISPRGRNFPQGHALADMQSSVPQQVHGVSSNTAPTPSSASASPSGALHQQLPALSTPPWQAPLRCPRCGSYNTKFSYYNNNSMNQPRHHCNTCKRRWTHGGKVRDVPVGSSIRKTRRKTAPVATLRTPSCEPPATALPEFGLASGIFLSTGGSATAASSEHEVPEQLAGVVSTNSTIHGGRSSGGVLSLLDLDDNGDDNGSNVIQRSALSVSVVVQPTLQAPVACTGSPLPANESNPELCCNGFVQHDVLPSIGINLPAPSMSPSSAMYYMELLELASLSAAPPNNGAGGMELHRGSSVAATTVQHMATGAVDLTPWWSGMDGPNGAFQ